MNAQPIDFDFSDIEATNAKEFMATLGSRQRPNRTEVDAMYAWLEANRPKGEHKQVYDVGDFRAALEAVRTAPQAPSEAKLEPDGQQPSSDSSDDGEKPPTEETPTAAANPEENEPKPKAADPAPQAAEKTLPNSAPDDPHAPMSEPPLAAVPEETPADKPKWNDADLHNTIKAKASEQKIPSAAEALDAADKPDNPYASLPSGAKVATKKQEQAADENEPDLDEATQPYPEFPRLIGILDELASTVAPSLAYSQKALYTLTVVGLKLSGCVKLATDPWLQPRFYGVSIAPAGQTKSAVEKEMRQILLPQPIQQSGGINTYRFPPLPGPNVTVEFSVNSGPALVQLFGDGATHILLAPDEMTGLFEKARSTATSPNTLMSELLRLYEGNETGRTVVRRGGDKGAHITVPNAHLAIFGGATPQSFDRMWRGTGGEGVGAQSRFILCYSDCPLPPFQQLTDEKTAIHVLSQLRRQLEAVPEMLTITDEAQQLVIDWVKQHEGNLPTRSLDMAKRAAMIVAATGEAKILSSGTRAIDERAMAWGLAFADYQIVLKKRLMPSDADGNVQAFENRVIGVYERNKKATERQARRVIHPERYPGGHDAFGRAFYALIRSGRLKVVAKTTAGTKIYELD